MSDQIDRYAPALSATSDMPEMAPDPAPVEPTVDAPPSAEPQPAPEPAHTESEEPALSESVEPAPEPVEEAAPPEPRGVGKALAAKDAAIAAARAEAAEARRQTEATLKAMEALAARIQAPPEAIPAEPVDTRPSREQFNSPDEYDTALVEWAGRASARAAEAHLEKQAADRVRAEEAKAQQAKAQEENNKIVLDWNEKKAKALEELYDYTEVAERHDLSITQDMAQAIVHSPNGPHIAYHLGKNPEEATRIAKLPPAQQLFEIGSISARLAAPKANVSKAPDPIRPVRSSVSSAVAKTPDEMSMEEYAAWRQPRLEAERRRPGSSSVH